MEFEQVLISGYLGGCFDHGNLEDIIIRAVVLHKRHIRDGRGVSGANRLAPRLFDPV